MQTRNMPIPKAKRAQFVEVAIACNARNIEVYSWGESGVLRVAYLIDDVNDANQFGERWRRLTTPIVEIERSAQIRRWNKVMRQLRSQLSKYGISHICGGKKC